MLPEITLTNSAEETTQFGRAIAASLQSPVLILLKGDLGAGKTTLAKGIISGLGAAREEDITSPTFNLVHVFQNQAPQPVKVYHVDLYRLDGAHDLESIALDDVLAEPCIAIIEWSERLTFRTAWPLVRIELEHGGGDRRSIRVTGAEGFARPGSAHASETVTRKAT
jgi:tRNA threonylcarbamoyladenosine biosynthesis protein TsaE